MPTIKAYAKVNLTLEVLGRRDDGYHDIASIVQTVDLFDTLSLEPSETIELEWDRPEPVSPDNLVLRAAAMLRDVAGVDKGAQIRLQKAVPLSAGLGGGSSDAAAALHGLNQIWQLGMSIDDLMPVAADLGSDVPFFLHGGTAMVQGRGERVRPLPPADLEWLILLVPDIHIPDKTAMLYGSLSDRNMTRGALTRKLEARIMGGGDVPPQFLFNAFDEVASDAFPGLEEYREGLSSAGAREVHLAGSGPTLFAPVSSREVGTAFQLILQHQRGWQAHLVSTHQPSGVRR